MDMNISDALRKLANGVQIRPNSHIDPTIPHTECGLANVKPVVFIEGDRLAARLDVHPDAPAECARCAGTLHPLGPPDEFGTRRVSPCHAGRVRIRCDLFTAAGIPARYIDHDPLSLPETDREKLDAMNVGDRGYWFHGPIGTGKTARLCQLLWYLTLYRGIPCRYQDITDLLSSLREAYNSPLNDESIILARLAASPVLVLDDLGQSEESQSSHESRVLSHLIDVRYRRGLCTTHIISNSSPDDLARYSSWSRTISRLLAMTLPRHIVGRDRRRV